MDIDWGIILTVTIPALATLVGSYLAVWKQNKDAEKREEKKRQFLKQQLFKDVVDQNWLGLAVMYNTTFPKATNIITQDEISRLMQPEATINEQYQMIRQVKDLLNTQLQYRKGNKKIEGLSGESVIPYAKGCIYVLETVQEIAQQYSNEISFLRDEFRRLSQILPYKERINLALKDQKYDELCKSVTLAIQFFIIFINNLARDSGDTDLQLPPMKK